MGDALAVACMHAKGFTKEDFARSHPGGALGRTLLTHVKDVMRTGEEVPVVLSGTTVLGNKGGHGSSDGADRHQTEGI